MSSSSARISSLCSLLLTRDVIHSFRQIDFEVMPMLRDGSVTKILVLDWSNAFEQECNVPCAANGDAWTAFTASNMTEQYSAAST